jgi:hypothetical protein
MPLAAEAGRRAASRRDLGASKETGAHPLALMLASRVTMAVIKVKQRLQLLDFGIGRVST